MTDTRDLSFFRERTVVVTGGGRGIGRAVCERFAGLGAAVHVVSRTDNAQRVALALREAGGRATGHVGTVEDGAFCRDVVRRAEAADGGPDVVVNAAAVLGPAGPLSAIDPAVFREVLSVNLLGAAHFMRWALPGMERRGFGRIVNVAGGGAAYAYPMFSAYGASKAALVRLTETVAEEVRTADVTVNIIAPGAVATDMLDALRRGGGEVRTLTDICEPVALIEFLAGPRAGHISGRFIHVRDEYRDPSLFARADMLKLRRVELR